MTPAETAASATAVVEGLDADQRRAGLVALVERALYRSAFPLEDLLGNTAEQAAVVAGLLAVWPAADGWTHGELAALLKPAGRWYHVGGFSPAADAVRAVLVVLARLTPEQLGALSVPIELMHGAMSFPNGVVDTSLSSAVARYLPAPLAVDAVLARVVHTDGWAVAVRHRVRAANLSPTLVDDVLTLCQLVGSGKQAKTWDRRFAGIANRADAGGAELLLRILVGELPSAGGPDDWSGFRYDHPNESVAAGACALFGRWAARSLGTDTRSAAELLSQAAFWGARWHGNRPMSGPVARGAVDGLAQLGTDRAVVELHALQQRFGTRPGLSKALTAALDGVLEANGRTIAEILASAGPTFGLDEHARRSWSTDGGSIELSVDDGEAVVTSRSNHETLSDEFRKAMAEAADVASALDKELVLTGQRFDGYLRDRSTFTVAEYQEFVDRHAVTSIIARSLVWEYRLATGWCSGLPGQPGETVADDGTVGITNADELRLWHPADASADEVDRWRALLMREHLYQPVRQVFREIYEPTRVLPEGCVRTSKAEALLRSRGWQLHGLGGWDGGQETTATRQHPSSGFTVSVVVSTLGFDGQGPRGAEGLATIGPPTFDHGRLDASDVRVTVLRSEALRDLELVATAAAPASRVLADPQSPFHAWQIDESERALGGAGLVRRDVLRRLLATSLADQPFELTDRLLVIRGRDGETRVHLGSGSRVGADRATRRLGRGSKLQLPWLPIERDGMLARIVKLALAST